MPDIQNSDATARGPSTKVINHAAYALRHAYSKDIMDGELAAN